MANLQDGDELCTPGVDAVNNITENEEIAAGFNLLDNAVDPVVVVAAVDAPTLLVDAGDLDLSDIVISSDAGPTAPFEYTFTSSSGESLLTVRSDGEVTLVHSNGEGAFAILGSDDVIRISLDYVVSDGDELGFDSSTAEICITGEAGIRFEELSNLVLYLLNGDTGDIKKVKFEAVQSDIGDNTSELDYIAGLINDASPIPGHEPISINDMVAFVEQEWLDPTSVLLGYGELLAFTYAQGKNAEEFPLGGKQGKNKGIIQSGEGQLVYLGDGKALGFPVDGFVSNKEAKEQNEDVDVTDGTLSAYPFALAGSGLALNDYAALRSNQYIDGGSFIP